MYSLMTSCGAASPDIASVMLNLLLIHEPRDTIYALMSSERAASPDIASVGSCGTSFAGQVHVQSGCC
eukprot:6059501-Amphidinium_carterae.2